jgi:hypothetical protein
MFVALSLKTNIPGRMVHQLDQCTNPTRACCQRSVREALKQCVQTYKTERSIV